MNKSRFTFSSRFRSISCALNGIRILISTQHNAWIHLFATAIIIPAGFYFHLVRTEWLWIILAVTSVWAAEAFNTAIEYLTDLASPEIHPLAGKAKDVAAGAVLITAMSAAVIGLLSLGPHVCLHFCPKTGP